MAGNTDQRRISRVNLELQGPVDHLRLVWQTGETLLEGLEFHEDPAGTRFNVLVAVQEIVTNAIRHGHRMDFDQPIRVRFEVDQERFRVEVRDCGEPFELREWLDDDRPEVQEELPEEPGGFGILIASLVMDRIDYRREDGWNVLTLERRADARRKLDPALQSLAWSRRPS